MTESTLEELKESMIEGDKKEWESIQDFRKRKTHELYEIRDQVEYKSLNLDRRVRNTLIWIGIPAFVLCIFGGYYIYTHIDYIINS